MLQEGVSNYLGAVVLEGDRGSGAFADVSTGEVCVAPDLPFGGDNSNAIKASGVFGKKEDRLWLPVSAYLIEHPKGKFLVDTGWAREMSPNGEFDKKAQIKSLGSVMLYAAKMDK